MTGTGKTRRRDPSVRNSGAGRRGTATGFTLAEMALAMTVLLVAIMSISAATLRSHALRRQNRDLVIAQNAARSLSESIHATSLQFSEDPATWAQNLIQTYGPFGGVGADHVVPGLTPVAEHTPLLTVEIITDETLSDDQIGAELGMPRDLDGDGLVDNTDVTATARMLPVVVRLRWRGASGDRNLSHPFFVLGY